MTEYDKKRYTRNLGDLAIVADAAMTPWARSSAERRAAKREAISEAEKKVQEQARFTAKTQPRDINGRFRKILARLKLNLGGEATEALAKKIEETEAAQVAGNYGEMRKNGGDLIDMLNGIDSGSISKGAAKNLRRGASDLGRVMAYLPLPQGNENAKVRFSDLPPATSDMVRSMVERVEENLAPDVAEKYVAELKGFMSGARTMTSDEMSVYLNKLLRVLA